MFHLVTYFNTGEKMKTLKQDLARVLMHNAGVRALFGHNVIMKTSSHTETTTGCSSYCFPAEAPRGDGIKYPAWHLTNYEINEN